MEAPNIKKCPKCGATWMEDQLYWSTGNKGTNEDLAGLVCDGLTEEVELCINEMRGKPHNGDTWAKRAAKIELMDLEVKEALNRLKDTGLE